MQIAALRTGIGVPAGDFTATVHSVFRHACLVALAGHGIVTLLPATAGGMPGAINVDAPEGFDFSRAVPEGAYLAARAGMLRFSGAELVVDLRSALSWRSRLDRVRLTLGEPRSLRAWFAAASRLAADGHAGRSSPSRAAGCRRCSPQRDGAMRPPRKSPRLR